VLLEYIEERKDGMNKKKAKQFKFTLLPPMGFITELAGINIQKILNSFFKGEVSERTLINTFTGKNKPNKTTSEKIIKAMPGLEQNRYMRFVLFGEDFPDENQNQWTLQLESFRIAAGIYADEFFPYFQEKLKTLIKVENKIDKKSTKPTNIKEEIDAYKNIDFVDSLFSREEKSILYDDNCTEQDTEVILITTFLKMTLYCAAHLDAEYSYGYQDEISIKDGKSSYEKVSLVRAILPRYEKKYISSVEMLFRSWKKNFKTTYTKMEQHIKVSGYEETKQASQKRKFRQWRKGEKVASPDEILNIIYGIRPIEDSNKDWSLDILTFYHISLFWSNYFKLLKNIKVNGKKIFDKEEELVSWMQETYNKFFDEAYADVEKYYESA